MPQRRKRHHRAQLGGEGWLRGCRWLQVPVMLLLALANLPVPGLAWGERGHKLINAAAVENLPEPLRSYFLARKAYWVGHYWEHEWPNCVSVPDNMAMYAWQQRPGIDCLFE